MRIQDLRRLRELVLVEYLEGRFSMETAQVMCRVLTRAIEKMAKKVQPAREPEQSKEE